MTQSLTYQAKLAGSSILGVAVVSLISISINAVVISLLLLGQTQLADPATHQSQAQTWLIPIYALFAITLLAYVVGIALECWFFTKGHGGTPQVPAALSLKASVNRSTQNALKLYSLMGRLDSRVK